MASSPNERWPGRLGHLGKSKNEENLVAQKSVIILIDDLTGKELADGTGETVHFSLDGNKYELDIDQKGAEKLRSVLAGYVSAGRRISSSRSGRPRRVKTGADPGAVRAWAAANGVQVSDRGRIPSAVLAQFEAAGN